MSCISMEIIDAPLGEVHSQVKNHFKLVGAAKMRIFPEGRSGLCMNKVNEKAIPLCSVPDHML